MTRAICQKKKFDRPGARLAILNARKKRKINQRRREVRFYWCATCGAYHLTSQQKRSGDR